VKAFGVLAIWTVIGTIVPPLAAQDSVVVEPIRFGETVSGYVTSDDFTLQDNSRYERFGFMGDAGDEVTLLLTSADFNANMLLSDSSDAILANNDNGGGECNAHINATLPETGFYIVYVNTTLPGEVGQFQLTLMRGTHPPQSETGCMGFVDHAGILGIGDTVAGALAADDRLLSDSSYFQVWLLDNPASVPFTVDMETSAFDGVMLLIRGLREVVTLDDDGAGGCNPRLTNMPQDQHPYRLVVFSRGKMRVGDYTLRATEGVSPLVDQPACHMGGE
jgi:hypothetical protein